PGGGKLEHGNTLEENVRTEILEEYCAEALKIEYLGHREIFRENNGTRTHWLAHDFRVLVDPAQVQNGEPHKADEIGWFALDAFP
ncbi:NUDIX domain-containing protein, partial [Klebsiella pneumoniae]|uniref:NUDIX domain-containing protein n=1 Tax=Klebsiella pneumoniae TaxID=573 RepID=UPI003EDE8ADA